MKKRSIALAALASSAAMAASAASAQVITNFNNFTLTQAYDAWTFPPPFTTITPYPTYFETASTRGYGSGYYDIYDSPTGSCHKHWRQQ